MAPATKRTPTKASAKDSATPPKHHIPTHPSWTEMIKECIISHPEETHAGVSRPAIKKFVEDKYHITTNHTTASQLNRAIALGCEKGTFSQPKGKSGKIKLATSGQHDAAKENTKPVSKRSNTTKVPPPKQKKVLPAKATTQRKPVGRTAATRSSPAKPMAKPSMKRISKRNIVTISKTRTAVAARKGNFKKKVIGEARKSRTKTRARSGARSRLTAKKPTFKAASADKKT